MAPTLSGSPKGGLVLGPIVQRSRIEVSARRPNQGVDLRVKADLAKGGGVTEGTEKLAFKNGLKVEGAAQPIVKADKQGVGRDVLE